MTEVIHSVDVLAARIEAIAPRGKPRLVAIDGRGGAGKSTLAKSVGGRLGASVVEVDDFWLVRSVRPGRERVIAEPGSDYDWPRIRDQVLAPLTEDRAARFQRYDWSTDRLGTWCDVEVGGTVVVEGVFSIRKELAPYYDLTVWVETDEAVCLTRGIERDGGQHDALWREEWMPAYRNYIEQSRPMDRADIIFTDTEAKE